MQRSYLLEDNALTSYPDFIDFLNMLIFSADLSTIAQNQPPATPQPQLTNPLINYSEQDITYLGMGLMAIIVIIIIGLLSHKLEYVIVFSLILASVIMLLVTLV